MIIEIIPKEDYGMNNREEAVEYEDIHATSNGRENDNETQVPDIIPTEEYKSSVVGDPPNFPRSSYRVRVWTEKASGTWCKFLLYIETGLRAPIFSEIPIENHKTL